MRTFWEDMRTGAHWSIHIVSPMHTYNPHPKRGREGRTPGIANFQGKILPQWTRWRERKMLSPLFWPLCTCTHTHRMRSQDKQLGEKNRYTLRRKYFKKKIYFSWFCHTPLLPPWVRDSTHSKMGLMIHNHARQMKEFPCDEFLYKEKT